MLPKTVILLKMQVADVSVDAKKFCESAITRAKHRWVLLVALGTRWREISSLWDLVLVSNWDLWTPVPWGPRISVLSPNHLRLNLFTVGDIFEGTFSGTPGFLGLKLFVILLFSSVQSNLSQTSTNQRPLVEKGIFPAFPNITALQSGILKIPS